MFSDKLKEYRDANVPIHQWGGPEIKGLLDLCIEEMRSNCSNGDSLVLTRALGDRVNATVNLVFKGQLVPDLFKTFFIENTGTEDASYFFANVKKTNGK